MGNKIAKLLLIALLISPVAYAGVISTGAPGGGGGGGGSPGGSSGSVQYNNSGAFGGFGGWDGTTLTVPGAIDASGPYHGTNNISTVDLNVSVPSTYDTALNAFTTNFSGTLAHEDTAGNGYAGLLTDSSGNSLILANGFQAVNATGASKTANLADSVNSAAVFAQPSNQGYTGKLGAEFGFVSGNWSAGSFQDPTNNVDIANNTQALIATGPSSMQASLIDSSVGSAGYFDNGAGLHAYLGSSGSAGSFYSSSGSINAVLADGVYAANVSGNQVFQNGGIVDNTSSPGILSIDPNGRFLFASDGTETAIWQNPGLFEIPFNLRIDGTGIQDNSGFTAISTTTRTLDDENGVGNISWNTSASSWSFNIQAGANAQALNVTGKSFFESDNLASFYADLVNSGNSYAGAYGDPNGNIAQFANNAEAGLFTDTSLNSVTLSNALGAITAVAGGAGQWGGKFTDLGNNAVYISDGTHGILSTAGTGLIGALIQDSTTDYTLTAGFNNGTGTHYAALAEDNSAHTIALADGVNAATAVGNISATTFSIGAVTGKGSVLQGSGGTPTCGTGCTAIRSGATDLRGSATTGTLTTSMVINFSTTLSSVPYCTVSDSSPSSAAGYVATTTTLTITFSTGLTSGTITWNCPL